MKREGPFRTRASYQMKTAFCAVLTFSLIVGVAQGQPASAVTGDNTGKANESLSAKKGALDSYLAENYLISGLAKGDKHDWDGAIADYTQAINLNPEFADAYFNRGFSKVYKGDLDGAIADYTKAIEFKPDDAEA